MYIQETFRKAYDAAAANWTNAILYFVPTIAMMVIGGAAGAGAYAALLLLSFSGGLLNSPFLMSITFIGGAILLAAIIALSIAVNLMSSRVSYLTCKNTRLETSIPALNGIVAYAKANFMQLLKLQLIAGALSIAVMALIFGAVWFAFVNNAPLPVQIAGAAATVAGVLVLAVLTWAFSTANSLFFMGNEKTGTLALLGKAWGLVTSNLIEYVMFWIAYGLLAAAFGIAYLATLFVPVLGSAVGIALSFGFSFFASVLMFSFVANFAASKKV